MGQDDGSLYALELETLRRLARFDLGGTLGAAAIARGQLYVANETTVFALGLPDSAERSRRERLARPSRSAG